MTVTSPPNAGDNLSSDATLVLTNFTSVTNASPNLASLADNGGPTLTLALLPASPAIRAGDTNGAPQRDQRGMPRKSLHLDAGAFETQIVTSSVPSTVTGTIAGSATMTNEQFRITFTNLPGASFSVWTTTNLSLPLSDWMWLGYPREITPGAFEFDDLNFTNNPQEFYRVTSP
ncbi:MAG TPA: choice-of-anchor Q domain-containing protein [Verrucomicrobiae bacterium]|nr:choice-of-anchor Q domain-containing protein [Verrucomicrobiae bacterium]